MEKVYVGIDVGKDDFKVVVKDEHNCLVMGVRTYEHNQSGFQPNFATLGSWLPLISPPSAFDS